MERLFVCEKCGHAVPRDAKRCVYCGQVFNGVKCPACGFRGEPALFEEGCPGCGFTGDVSGSVHARGRRPWKKKAFGERSAKKKKRMLPIAIYRIAGIISLLILIALIIVILRFYV
jgi:uncharacterized membrane protein YvbJ